jgi:phosphoribosylglycinamide formyltransferase-1
MNTPKTAFIAIVGKANVGKSSILNKLLGTKIAIVSSKLIDKYPYRIMNIHPSLIPSFCGPGYYGIHVHEEVFKCGVKVSGATVHFVSTVVDGGPIILQKAIDISDCNSPEEIQEKILINIEHKILVKAVKLYCDNKLKIENERVMII